MRLSSVLCALALSPLFACGFAAEGIVALGTWSYGPGTIADVPAVEGSVVAADTEVVAGDTIVRLNLAKAPQSILLLEPGTHLRLIEEGTSIIVRLESGTLQANIDDKGPYSDLHVVGAALDVRVTGTLFVVERVKADTDYVALVQGKVKVNLRREVAQALNQSDGGVELISHQGVGGSATGGLASIDALSARPQLASSFSARTPVRDQGLGGHGDWNADHGLTQTTVIASSLNANVVEQVRQQVSQQVSNQVTQQVSQQVTQTIVQEVIGGTATPLGTPPAPPH
jgi:hypothetical protein